MIITLRDGSSGEEVKSVCEKVKDYNLDLVPHVQRGVERTIIAVIGDLDVSGRADSILDQIGAMLCVGRVDRISKSYKLAARKSNQSDTIIDVGHGVKFGGEELVVVAGPCAIESEEQLRAIAEAVRSSGARALRGGAFKPRTNPRSFEGLREDGLKMLHDVGEEMQMPTQTEVMTPSQVPLVARYADILQIGTRNMQNYDLLKEVGKTKKPVVLKRGMSSTYAEWLGASEYILDGGNPNVIFCERGIRTFEPETRNTPDGAAVPYMKGESHLPIQFDPSHAVGKRDLIPRVAAAGVAGGADSLVVEVHHKPEEALCDGNQSLRPREFEEFMQLMRSVAQAVGRVVYQAQN